MTLHPAARMILETLRDITPEGQSLRHCYPCIEIDNLKCDAPLEVALRDWQDAGFPMPEEDTNGNP